MTTLVGIRAGKGNPGVVLGSDLSATFTNWKNEGDVFYKKQTKSEVQKIYINPDRTAALCMTGKGDSLYSYFLHDFLEGKFDLEKITKEGFFNEVLGLNLNRWGGKIPDDRLNAFLLATRFKEPRLYTCWPLGNVEGRMYTSIGSGSDYALKYLDEIEYKIPSRTSIEDAIDLTITSLDKASQDIYTGGLDLIILTKNGIFDLGNKIRKEMDSAKLKAIEEGKKQIE